MGCLAIQQIRYELSSNAPLTLHHDLPTITMRGAFGYALAQVVARRMNLPELEDQVVVYRQLFMPQNDGLADSRNQELARPFVLRGGFSRPDRRSFLLDVFLFGKAIPYETIFDETVDTMAMMGLGERHQKCIFKKVTSIPLTIADPEPKPFLAVQFLSPCSRLKSQGKVFLDEVPFPVLMSRLIDRVEELISLYGDGDPLCDFLGIGQLKRLAEEVCWKKLRGGQYKINRISGRTGDIIKMDGFLGIMEYCGYFEPFRRYLKYLPYVNIGRFSAFGCGWCKMKYLENEV